MLLMKIQDSIINYYKKGFTWLSLKETHGKILFYSMIVITVFPLVCNLMKYFKLTSIIPLRLWLIYFSSLCYFSSLSLYKWLCPKLIKNYVSYADFEAKEEEGGSILISIMEDNFNYYFRHVHNNLSAYERNNLHYWMKFLNDFTETKFSDYEFRYPKIEYLKSVQHKISESKLKPAFYQLRERENVRLRPVIIISKMCNICSHILAVIACAKLLCQILIPWPF